MDQVISVALFVWLVLTVGAIVAPTVSAAVFVGLVLAGVVIVAFDLR